MDVVHYIFDYFVAPENRNKEPIRLDNDRGIILTWGKKNSIDNLMMYTNFITSLIKYANELGIDVIKTAELIQKGNLKKLGYYYEDVFLSIFLDSIREDNDGKDIKENVLSYNSKNLDK